MDLKTLINEKEAAGGKWFPMGDAGFLIAPRGGKYETKLAKLTDLHRKGNRNREPKAEERRAINIRAAIGTCLLDWRGITKDGAEIPFSSEVAETVLQTYPTIREMVFEAMGDESAFVDAPAEEGDESGAEEPESGAEADLKSGPGLEPAVQ